MYRNYSNQLEILSVMEGRDFIDVSQRSTVRIWNHEVQFFQTDNMLYKLIGIYFII